MRPDPRHGIREAREDLVSVAPRLERAVEGCGGPFRAETDERAKHQSGDRHAATARGEPSLCEPETGKREDDAAEDQQLGAFLELRRACEPDPVRRRCAADLLDLLGGEHGHRIGPALHGDECLRDRGMELCARIALDLGERGLVRQPGTVRPVGRHRVEAVSND